MGKVKVIVSKELKVFFESLSGYLIIGLFLITTGLFTWILSHNVFSLGQASLGLFFGVSYWTLFMFIPALTMRTISEERRSGMLEILFTKPIKNWHLIVGKFFSTLILVVISLTLTLGYYFTVSKLGNIDHGAVIGGYLGLLLMSSAYISLGIMVSSWTGNQLISFILTMVIGIFFHFIFSWISVGLNGSMSNFFEHLSLSHHFELLSRGVINLSSIIYMLSLSILFLLFATNSLSSRK